MLFVSFIHLFIHCSIIFTITKTKKKTNRADPGRIGHRDSYIFFNYQVLGTGKRLTALANICRYLHLCYKVINDSVRFNVLIYLFKSYYIKIQFISLIQ